jgi:16S rRNA (guanine966-N2)-methyltransferase
MSHLRVISGTAKGRRLKMVPGQGTRPVTDRVKESLFNIIGPLIVDAAFLDLFAGTGSVGVEALSRGAARAVFLDTSAAAIGTIKYNLRLTGLQSAASVIRVDAFEYLRRGGVGPFDFVYVAPPQYQGLWSAAVRLLDMASAPLNPDAWVIAQLDPNEEEQLDLDRLRLSDRRKYGSTLLLFYEASSEGLVM